MNLRYIAVCVVCALLSACSTPYTDRSPGAMSFWGGVSATKIGADRAKISAQGNAYTTGGTISNYLLLRAADETLQSGYDYFHVTAGVDETRYESLPGVSLASAGYKNGRDSVVGLHLPPSGQAYPAGSIVIEMAKAAGEGPLWYDAHAVRANMGPLVDK